MQGEQCLRGVEKNVTKMERKGLTGYGNVYQIMSVATSDGRKAMYNQALTMDQLQLAVPSAFATQAHESRSSRYTYIPTSDIIAGMIKEGF